MSATRRMSLVLSLVAVTMVWLITPAAAAETANSQIVIIREGDVVADDLYAGAVRVLVQGRIEGDLVAFAAEELVIEGTVEGSVIALSPRVTVDGRVEGSLRVVTNDLSVFGSVAGDLVAAALDMELAPESTINGEVLAWAWMARSLGSIGALSGTQRTLEMSGSVGSDVDVSVGRLRVVDDLEVGGDLGYRSGNEASGLDRVEAGGVIVEMTPLPPNIRVRALWLFARFLVILFLTITALAVSWGWPDHTRAAMGTAGSQPLRSWARGAVVVFSPLFLVALTALVLALAPPAASFPLLAVFVPLVLATTGVVGALCLVAGIPVAGRLGSLVFSRSSTQASVFIGSVILGGLWLLPIAGWLVPLLALPLGLGAWVRGWAREGEGAQLPENGSRPAVDG